MSTKRRIQILIVFAVAALAMASVLVSTGHRSVAGTAAQEHEHEALVYRGATACGVERWSVKTGIDHDARLVNTRAIVPTTILHLRSLPMPASLPLRNRIRPTETTEFTVAGTLLRYKIEADSDVHLVIADSGGRTMIAEIPHPDCVGATSPFLSTIRSARGAFDARFHPQTFWQRPNVKVQVAGVGFFDFKHGQSGVAPNAIELHPVLKLQVGGQAPPPPPATVPPTGTVHVSASVSDTSPARFTTVTVTGKITVNGKGVPNVPMTAAWHYKTSTAVCSGSSDSSGTARCRRDIGRATLGFTVVIDVSFSYRGQTYVAHASFTPH